MRTGKKQLTLAASALAMAVALTGCGGGGGTALKDAGSGSGVYTGAASFAETRASQHSAIRTAITAAQGALNGLDNNSSDMDLDEADGLIEAISSAIDAGTYLSASEKADYEAMQTALMATLMVRKQGVMAQREVTRLTGELDMANGNNQDLQDQLTAAQDKVTMLETDLGMANDKVTMLETDLGTANDKITGLEGDLGTANDKITGLEGDLGTANDKITGLEGDLGTANDKITGLEGDLAVANGKIETLERQIERQDGDLKALNEQLSDEKLKVQGLETDLEAEKGKVTQLTMDLEAEKGKVTQLTMDLEAEKGKVTQLTMDLETEQGKVTQLTMDLETEQGKVTDLQGQLDDANVEITDLEKQLAEKDAEINRLKGQLDEARQGPQRVAVQKAITELEMALAKVDASASEDDVKAADAALMAARQAITDATYLPEEETGDLTGEVNTIAMNLDTAKMTRTTSLVAATKEMAIEDEAAQTDDAGLGGSAATATGNDKGAYTLAIKYGETSITVEGATDAADEKFMQDMDLGDGTTMHTRTMDADSDGNIVQEVVVVTTDIEAPKPVAFAKFKLVAMNGTTTTPQALNVRQDGETMTDEMPYDSLTVTAGTEDANLPLIKSPSFAAAQTGSSSVTHEFQPADGDPDTDGDQPRAAAMVPGTYNGAMGTYTCAVGGDDCTATVDEKGMLTAISDGWVFTPDAGATSDEPDYDYYHYGFWLKKITDKDDVLTYDEVETFAGSSVDASGPVSSVAGMAKYEGNATGVYVHTEDRPDGMRKKATSGHFTADAMLTATFGQVNDATDVGTIAPNMLHMLTGTIDNFMLSGGEAQNWMVKLQSTRSETGTHMGTAKGGVGNGSFSATYYGDVMEVDGVTPQPGSVVGEFNAGFTNGSVAGAFGARKMMD